MAAPRFLARNPHITNNAADDPVGNSRPPSISLNPAGRVFRWVPGSWRRFRRGQPQASRPAPAGIKAAICGAGWPAGLGKRHLYFVQCYRGSDGRITGEDTHLGLNGPPPDAATPAQRRSGGDARQNAFESSGLVLRNPILLLSILAISGIACSGTSPATTPAATDFNRASCPGLKSRCLSGLGCRTSGSPPPHRQTGFWNHVASAAALAFRTSHARLAPSILLVFIANLRPNSNTLRSSRAMFSAGYG